MTTTQDSPAYLDPDQPLKNRVADLLERLTLDEKISLMCHGAAAVPRLGIPAYNYWSEALHGVAGNGQATVFPQAIGLGATWDPTLVKEIASAIGDEARAKYHAAFERYGETGHMQGLTFWSPNVNIFRDPRWGRGQETYGEDPHLMGKIGAAFVRGLQGDHPKYLKAAACAKHYAVHSGPEGDRHHFDAQVSLRDMHDTYLPAFQKLVTEAKVEAVMGAYNRVNGEPACAHSYLLQEVLRDAWGFEGHVVSDCWALQDIYLHHKLVDTPKEAAALALTRGCDLNCGTCTFDYLKEAEAEGLVDEEDIDQALSRTLGTRFKLGLFDPPERVPYTDISTDVVNCQRHRDLAYEAAVKSAVLLKNEDDLIPLDEKALTQVAVIGPNATSVDALLGNYNGMNDTLITLLEGVVGRAPEGVRVTYGAGCRLDRPNLNPHSWSLSEAQRADVVIAAMGISPLMEGEEGAAILSPTLGDRLELSLPGPQADFIRQLATDDTKVILVLFGGSPIALGDLADLVEAILFVWYPGQEGGRAIADLIFGDVAPSGRLPITFPKSVEQLPPFDDYAMEGRTYRYMSEEPLYPFGFGLTTTEFTYSDLELNTATLPKGESLNARFTLTNDGKRAADEVVQVYLSDLEASVPVPIQKLVRFRRISLEPGESERVEISIPPEVMMLVDNAGERRLEPGRFRLTIGGCAPGARGRSLDAPEPVEAEFTVEEM